MDQDVKDAFALGGGSGAFTADALLQMIGLVSVATLITFIAIVVFKSYSEWATSKIKPGSMLFIWFRGVFILLVGIYLFRF